MKELLLQSLEHERGGVKIYQTALKCVRNDDLSEEWEKYEQETETHVQILQDVFARCGSTPRSRPRGARSCTTWARRWWPQWKRRSDAATRPWREIVACECVVLAEEKDHFNWQLIGEVAAKMTGAEGKALKGAYKEVEDQEDEHYYHSKGWLRELSLEGLGLKAQLPPPEEKQAR